MMHEINKRIIMDEVKRFRQNEKPVAPFFDVLAVLTPETVSLVADSMLEGYAPHVLRLLTHCSKPQPDYLVAEFLKLMPELTDSQRAIARTYFAVLRNWRDGEVSWLDVMVELSNDYIEATGSATLPLTSERDQKLFRKLNEEPHLVGVILGRFNHVDDVTPELVDELSAAHVALVGGAL